MQIISLYLLYLPERRLCTCEVHALNIKRKYGKKYLPQSPHNGSIKNCDLFHEHIQHYFMLEKQVALIVKMAGGGPVMVYY
jgi:hypothetical protein